MSHHYDLQEQEQLAELRHFWSRYGTPITSAVLVVSLGFVGWNGWQWWQRRQAVEASVLLENLELAAQGKDADKVARVWADLSKQSAHLQVGQGGLLTARVLDQAGRSAEAEAVLRHVVDQSGDEGLVALARLRLAELALQARQPDQARQWLTATWPAGFEGLGADRLGDTEQQAGQLDAARSAYGRAYEALVDQPEYRRVVEAKLNALGVDPTRSTQP